jgi:hypothetical protein
MGLASGFLIALLGAWVVLRTITHDDGGSNLVDRLLSL